MTFPSRPSHTLVSNPASSEYGHGSAWSTEADPKGDQGAPVAAVEWVELGEKFLTKINKATVTNAHFDKAAVESGGLAADMSAGVVLQSAAAMESRVGVKNGPFGAGTPLQPIVIKDHTYLRISGVFDNSAGIVMEGYHYGANLIVAGSATLTGGGQVIMQTNLHPNNFIYGGTLTNLNNTISGAGVIGNNFAGTSSLNLINDANGLIAGTAGPDNGESGTYLLIDAASITNSGIIESYGTAGNTGVVIRGSTIDGSGGGLILATNDSTLRLEATVAGGTLSSTGNGVLDMYSGELDGRASAVHNTTNLMLNGNPGITLLGAIANTGTITVDANVGLHSSITIGAGGATLSGGGQVLLGPGTTIDSAATGDALTNFDNTITGTGILGASGGAGFITLINDAKGVIDGQSGLILASGTGTVTNHGLIEATGTQGLTLSTGVINGASGGVILATNGATVIVAGADIAGGTLSTTGSGIIRSNFGTLDGTNSAVHNTGALNIDAHYSLAIQGTINNTGTIGVLGGGFYDAYLLVNPAGATLTGGGQVYLGGRGLIQSGAAGDTLTNYDNTISGSGLVGARSGASLTLINGAKGVIDGNSSVALSLSPQSGTIFNNGLIEATSAAGIVLSNGVVDGSGSGTILAANGGVVTLGAGHVAGGTLSTAGSGVILSANGYLDGTHAAVHNTGALNINDHLDLAITGTINNTGVISVLGGGFYDSFLSVVGSGATLTGGGQVNLASRSYINAAAGAAFTNDGNTISGNGNFFYGQFTVVNRAGVIDASGSAPLTLPTVGGVITNGGTLKATGTGGLIIQNAAVSGTGGTIFAGAGSSVSLQSVTVHGGTSSTAAGGLINVGTGSTASLAGATANAGTIALAGSSLVVAANATLSGGGTVSLGKGGVNRLSGTSAAITLTNVDNTIVGTGQIGLRRLTLINRAAGVIDATAGAAMIVQTAGTLINAGLMESTGGGHLGLRLTTVNNTGGTLLAASGSVINLTGATIIGGTLQSSGTGSAIQTFAGINMIDGTASTVFNQGNLGVSDGTSLTIQGAFDNTGRVAIKAQMHVAHLVVGAAGLTLTGGGQVLMTDDTFNRIAGAGGAPTLDNVDNRIAGSGQIGAGMLTLINGAAGVIDATGTNALIINTGGIAIQNAGVIEAAGTGGASVLSAVANSGTLEAAGGTLTVAGAVSGSGSGVITSGTLDFTSTFNQAVKFTGSTGELELAHSLAYTASITGFSKTGGTSLDLRDIAFKTASEATFHGTASSGVLTVTDGTHTAHITLIGDYRTSTFTASSDGHGGTIIIDPTQTASAVLPHAFIAAAAGLGARAAGTSHPQPTLEHPPAMLLTPRTQNA